MTETPRHRTNVRRHRTQDTGHRTGAQPRVAPRALQCGTLNYCLQPPGVQRVPTTRPLLHSHHILEVARNRKDLLSEHLPFIDRENRQTAYFDSGVSDRCRYMIFYLVRKTRLRFQLSVKVICQVKSKSLKSSQPMVVTTILDPTYIIFSPCTEFQKPCFAWSARLSVASPQILFHCEVCKKKGFRM